MKTVTMDWDTYQKEIEDVEDKKERYIEEGCLRVEARYDPLVDYLKDLLAKGSLNYLSFKEIHNELNRLMIDIGELE